VKPPKGGFAVSGAGGAAGGREVGFVTLFAALSNVPHGAFSPAEGRPDPRVEDLARQRETVNNKLFQAEALRRAEWDQVAALGQAQEQLTTL
jgi:hypothetical protein